MMPLTMVNPGEENVIKKVGGKRRDKTILENLRLCYRRSSYRNL